MDERGHFRKVLRQERDKVRATKGQVDYAFIQKGVRSRFYCHSFLPLHPNNVSLTQAATDRAIHAEHSVHSLQEALMTERAVNMALTLATSSLTDASTDAIDLACPLLFESLLGRYRSVDNPSKKMEHFCASIMQMCLNQSTANGSVQSATGRHIQFMINNHQRKLKNMATP